MEPLAPLMVTTIGSWPWPGWYLQFCDDAARDPERFADDDRAEALRDAIRLAIDDQERAGADIVTDGEIVRLDPDFSFFVRFSGLERIAPTRRLGSPAPEQRVRYQCTGPVSAPKGLGLVDEFKRLTELTRKRPKITVPGPLMLADMVQGGKVYRDRDSIVEVMLPVVNRELRALVDAGATVLQIDEPGYAIAPEKSDIFVRLVERTAAGVRAFVTLHLCFGNDRGRPLGRRSYAPLFPDLAKCAVQELALEFASREMAELELLAQIKPPMGVCVGLVDVKSLWVEPPELVAERLRAVLKHIEPPRVRVAPDCGFGHTARPIAIAKLTNLAAGVQIVRKERGL